MDAWDSAGKYENYMGRWSRIVAQEFIDWLQPSPGLSWLDIGCGPGALSSVIADQAHPGLLAGLDTAVAYVAAAQRRFAGHPALFTTGDAQQLPFADEAFERAVSGLNLNFLPDAATGVSEMRRVVRPEGSIALYVWDYAAGMQFLHLFWEAATAADPSAEGLGEARRFHVANPDALRSLFVEASLDEIDVRAIEVSTPFPTFDAYWESFLTGQGPANAYVHSLTAEKRQTFRACLQEIAPQEDDGAVRLTATAWAIRGTVPAT